MSWCCKFFRASERYWKKWKKNPLKLKVTPLGYNVNETKFAACCKCISAYIMLQLFCLRPPDTEMSVLFDLTQYLCSEKWPGPTQTTVLTIDYCTHQWKILLWDLEYSGVQGIKGQRINMLDIFLWWHKGCWALFGIQVQSKWTISTMPHVSIWS